MGGGCIILGSIARTYLEKSKKGSHVDSIAVTDFQPFPPSAAHYMRGAVEFQVLRSRSISNILQRKQVGYTRGFHCFNYRIQQHCPRSNWVEVGYVITGGPMPSYVWSQLLHTCDFNIYPLFKNKIVLLSFQNCAKLLLISRFPLHLHQLNICH